MLCYSCGTDETVFVLRDNLSYDVCSGDIIAVCTDESTANRLLAKARESGEFYKPEVVRVKMVFHPSDIEEIDFSATHLNEA